MLPDATQNAEHLNLPDSIRPTAKRSVASAQVQSDPAHSLPGVVVEPCGEARSQRPPRPPAVLRVFLSSDPQPRRRGTDLPDLHLLLGQSRKSALGD